VQVNAYSTKLMNQSLAFCFWFFRTLSVRLLFEKRSHRRVLPYKTIARWCMGMSIAMPSIFYGSKGFVGRLIMAQDHDSGLLPPLSDDCFEWFWIPCSVPLCLALPSTFQRFCQRSGNAIQKTSNVATSVPQISFFPVSQQSLHILQHAL
jgi:hypothetical protein